MSIGDKIVLSRYRLSLRAFNFFIGFGQMTTGFIVLAVNPLPSVPLMTILGGLSVGVLWGLGLLLMFYVLQREEVSRVVPVFQSYPIFVAIMAFWLLGETIGLAGWVAVLLAVAGAVLVSADRSSLGRGFQLRPGLMLLLIGAFLAALAQIILKYVSDDLGVWHNLALRGIGLGMVMAIPTFQLRLFPELFRFIMRGKPGVLLIGVETVGALLGNLLLIYSITFGPVSLASAIMGTRPLFVFAASVVLAYVASHVLQENMERRLLAQKFVAAMMVVGALGLIAVA